MLLFFVPILSVNPYKACRQCLKNREMRALAKDKYLFFMTIFSFNDISVSFSSLES